TESEQMFTLTYQVARIAQGTHLERAVGREQSLLLMAGAESAVGVKPVSNLDPARISQVGRRLAKAVPWLSKGRFEESVRRFAAERQDDPGPLFDALDLGCLRLALIVSDDASCLNLLKARGPAYFGLSASAVPARLQDLLKFWVSPDAIV